MTDYPPTYKDGTKNNFDGDGKVKHTNRVFELECGIKLENLIANKGTIENMKQILDKCPQAVHYSHGHTVLHMAVKSLNSEIVALILTYNPNDAQKVYYYLSNMVDDYRMLGHDFRPFILRLIDIDCHKTRKTCTCDKDQAPSLNCKLICAKQLAKAIVLSNSHRQYDILREIYNTCNNITSEMWLEIFENSEYYNRLNKAEYVLGTEHPVTQIIKQKTTNNVRHCILQ